MEDYSKWHDVALEGALFHTNRDIETAQQNLTELEAQLAAIRTELARRKLAAFWQANEGLRLAVGDALIVTGQAREEENVLPYRHRWLEGMIVKVQSINPVTGNVRFENEEGSSIGVPLDIARRMRLAYLQAYEEAQP